METEDTEEKWSFLRLWMHRIKLMLKYNWVCVYPCHMCPCGFLGRCFADKCTLRDDPESLTFEEEK